MKYNLLHIPLGLSNHKFQINYTVIKSYIFLKIICFKGGLFMCKRFYSFLKGSALILLLTITLLINTSCSSPSEPVETNHSESSSIDASQPEKIVQQSSTEGNTSSEANLITVKYLTFVLMTLDELTTINNGLWESTQSLNTLAIMGYNLHGYEEGLSSLGVVSQMSENYLPKYQNFLNDLPKFQELDNIYPVDNSELKEISALLQKSVEQYNEAYNFSKEYIRTGNVVNVDRYYVHNNLHYDYKLEAEMAILNKKSEIYKTIMEYGD